MNSLSRVGFPLLAGVVLGSGLAGAALRPGAAPPPEAMVYPLTGAQSPVGDSLGAAQWFDTEWGWIVGTDGANAALAAEDMRAAIGAFYVHFGMTPRRGAIVEAAHLHLYAQIEQAGAAWQAPFMLDGNRAGFAEGGRIDARAALRHEIGHVLFVSLVAPNTRGNQYGGDAPDWLDEAAAMMAEGPDATAARRHAFADAVHAGRIAPFSALIAAEHPVYRAAAAAAGDRRPAHGKPGEGGMFIALDPSQAGLDGTAIADFYAGSRAVADYLIERSGDARILARVAARLRENGNPSGWLDEFCNDGILPVPRDRVDDDFAAWSAERAARH